MNRNIRSIVVYIVAVLLVTAGYFGIMSYREATLSKTMKDTLYKYFEDNNNHISSHDFAIDDVKIRCKGNNAYLVEFNLSVSDDTSDEFNDLAATVYKKNNTWNVKGFGAGLTNEEIKEYNFKCYY
jgi:archaellum component FlaG (FlaF/FlaG flagellin family)